MPKLKKLQGKKRTIDVPIVRRKTGIMHKSLVGRRYYKGKE